MEVLGWRFASLELWASVYSQSGQQKEHPVMGGGGGRGKISTASGTHSFLGVTMGFPPPSSRLDEEITFTFIQLSKLGGIAELETRPQQVCILEATKPAPHPAPSLGYGEGRAHQWS